MLPKIHFKIDFKTNFSAFVIYLFEEFPGCTEDALSKINKLGIKKEIDKIKRKETLEDDKKFLKELSRNPFALKKKIPEELFEHIYSNYNKYYAKNEKLFSNRAKRIKSKLNNKRIKQILKMIEDEPKKSFKPKIIDVWLVDIYYLIKEKNIEGTTTKEGIYLGLPNRPINLFYSTLIHELVHYNIMNRYSENEEEVIAQLLGLQISKRILGKVPSQSIIIAKRRIKKITKKDFKVVINIWENKNNIDKFLKATFR